MSRPAVMKLSAHWVTKVHPLCPAHPWDAADYIHLIGTALSAWGSTAVTQLATHQWSNGAASPSGGTGISPGPDQPAAPLRGLAAQG